MIQIAFKPNALSKPELNLRLLPTVLIVGFMLGTTLVISRFGLVQFSPFTFVSLRLAFASAAFLIVYAVFPRRRFPLSRHFWLHGFVWALFGTVIPMTSVTASLLYQSSGLTSLLISSNPALVAIMAHFAFSDERLTLQRAVGAILSFSGAALVIIKGESGIGAVPMDWRGPALVLLAICSASTSLIFVKYTMRRYRSFDIAMVRIVAALPIVLALAVFTERLDLSGANASGNVALIYAGLVGTFGALVLGVNILQRFGASYATQPAYVQPLVASLGGVILLHEQVSFNLIVGIIIVLAGTWLVSSDVPADKTLIA